MVIQVSQQFNRWWDRQNEVLRLLCLLGYVSVIEMMLFSGNRGLMLPAAFSLLFLTLSRWWYLIH